MQDGNQSIITANCISKLYQIYSRPQDRLKQALFRGRKFYEEFWALRDVSIEVGRGETVGIIGRNGSGKSTLLQIICGTLRPTGGAVSVNGRVSALLELGSGFNPDFTGKENVFLNASILGLNKDEIDSIYDDIVSFADIGAHIDQPTKTYSSGMAVRLAFSVAINVSPDILVVDEALAVGDEAFQRRCLARLNAIRDAGATVLFVSHSSGQIISLCDRVVLLDRGEKIFDGHPRIGINYYHKLLYMPVEKVDSFRESLKRGEVSSDIVERDLYVRSESKEQSMEVLNNSKQEDINIESQIAYYNPGLVVKSTLSYERRGAEIYSVLISTLDGRRVNTLVKGQRFRIEYRVRYDQDAYGVAVGTLVKTPEGFELAAASTMDTAATIGYARAGTEWCVFHEFTCHFTRGTYFINCGVSAMVGGARTWLHRISDAAMFQVMADQTGFSKGPVDLEFYSHTIPADKEE